MVWRFGNMIDNGQIYYYGAYQKAVREFLWAPQRLQTFGPSEYIREIHKTEMRLTYTTGTFVKCDGADEFRISKGFEPDVVILDEFADYPEDFWPAMSPNFMPKDTIVIIISSPPWLLETEPGKPVLFTRIADLWKARMEKAHKVGKHSKYFYVNQPSHVNAENLPPGFLEAEKEDLTALGLEDIWEREYCAKRVLGGGKRIVGTFDRTLHMKSHDWIMDKISKDVTILQWGTAADPSQSAFAILNVAVNPNTKEVFFLDEILEKEADETTEHILLPRIIEKENELFPETLDPDPDRFYRVCDEAAQWWIVGCRNDPTLNTNFNPTQKATNSIEFGLSILRDIFRYNKAYVSDRCKWFMWQLENWRKTKTGQLPDKDCDLIDCGRYILHELSYYLTSEDKKEIIKPHARDDLRALRKPIDEEALALRQLVSDPLGISSDRAIHSSLDDLSYGGNRWEH